MTNEKPWIDVFPLNGSEVKIVNSGTRVSLNKELSDYCNEQWKPKAEKNWKSSWIAFAKSLTLYSGSKINQCEMEAGAIPFYQVDGMNKAMEEGKPFAPQQGFNPSLSVGFLTATKDGYIVFQRRAPDVHCPNILIHEPCGYMASMAFAPRQECDLEKYAEDERLFDLNAQYESRKNEIAKTFGVSPEVVSYDLNQDLLATGWMTKEMYFSTTGKINAKKSELTIPEKEEFFFVPFENLRELIYNQGRLSQTDVSSPEYERPEEATEIPLIDESLIGLIYGYEKLTGEKLDITDTIARLNHSGMNIRVYGPSADFRFSPKTYEFQTSF